MKVECLRERLTSTLSRIQNVLRKNPTLSILSCVLLEAGENLLKTRSTNLDVGIEVSTPVKVEIKGLVAVPGSVLSNYIISLSNDRVLTLETVGQNLSISSSHNRTLIKAFDPTEFPIIPTISSEKTFRINTNDLVGGIEAVSYSSGTSHVKPELASVYIYYDDGNIVFVATDSFRLAEKKIKMKKAKEFDPLLIPFKNATEVRRVLAGLDEEIEVTYDKNQVVFKNEWLYLTSRLIDGIFPDYKQIIPKEFKTEVVLLKTDLVNTFRLATIFSDTFSQVNIEVKPSEKLFRINTTNPDVGENSNLPDATVKGQDLEINFNYRYITECFQSINSDSVALHFNGLSRPVVIQGVSDRSFTYLVMPMNK